MPKSILFTGALLLISLFIFSFSGKQIPSKKISRHEIDSLQNFKNNIPSFLECPFDIHKFKKKTNAANSNAFSKSAYHYRNNPKGIYYAFYWPERGAYSFRGDSIEYLPHGWNMGITTFQPPGKHENLFINPREILVEYCASKNDIDLPELAFIGQSKNDIINKLGSPNREENSILIYSSKNNVLFLQHENERISAVKYVKLNFQFDTLKVVPLYLIEKLGCKGG